MKLAMNSGYFQGIMSTEEMAKLISEAGFGAVDYSLMAMVHPDYIYNGANYLSVAEETGRILSSYSIPVVQTHTPFEFADFNAPFFMETTIRSIEASAALGAEIAVVHPLHHVEYAGHEEEIFQWNMDFYRSLIPVCKSCDIKIGIENMFQRDKKRGFIVHDTCSTVAEFCRYIDTLNSEYMVACLDVGHVSLPMQTTDASDMIRILGHERLHALHIHDNDYHDDRHVAPFSGNIDWYGVTKALGEIDYDGDFTYEIGFGKYAGCADRSLYPAVLRYLAQVGLHLVDQVNKNRPNKDNS